MGDLLVFFLTLRSTIFSSARYVLAGTNQSDDGSGVERRVKRLFIHPKFSVGPYWVDANQFEIKQVGFHSAIYTLHIKGIPANPTYMGLCM